MQRALPLHFDSELTGEQVLENDNIVTISMLSMDQNGCALRLKIKIDVS